MLLALLVVAAMADMGVMAGWGQWEAWSACTDTCGQALRVRGRACANTTAAPSGHCVGNEQQVEKCNTTACPGEEHGGWSLWMPWYPCPVSCGGGIQLRMRECNNPKPAPNGNNCVGKLHESRACNSQRCSTGGLVRHGNWTDWTGWSICTSKCDGGLQLRGRTCTNPAPGPNGNECVGLPQESQECNKHECPAPGNGGWSVWGAWYTCTKSCGGGVTLRKRKCNDPPPEPNGKPCVGKDLESSVCQSQPCPGAVTNAPWSPWMSWSRCTCSCGGGLQIRKRVCKGQPGNECEGPAQDSRECNMDDCPIPVVYTDGGWSEWNPWYKCTVTCGGGVQMRDRKCDNPKPDPLGMDCWGDPHSTTLCNQQPCTTAIHGGWSVWADWAICTATCAGGIRLRERKCDNPTPALSGRYCEGKPLDVGVCNTKKCPPIDSEFIAFCARLDTNVTNAQGKVPFATVLYNSGGHFHHDDSSFIAPVKGLYSFSYSGATDLSPTLDLQLRYQTNQTQDEQDYKELAKIYSSSELYRNGAANAIQVMEKDSRAYVYIDESSTAGNLTFFCGMLVQRFA